MLLPLTTRATGLIHPRQTPDEPSSWDQSLKTQRDFFFLFFFFLNPEFNFHCAESQASWVREARSAGEEREQH
jgi:hypothetical protein